MAVKPTKSNEPASIGETFDRLAARFTVTLPRFLILTIVGMAGGAAIVYFSVDIEDDPRTYIIAAFVGAFVALLYFVFMGSLATLFSRMTGTLQLQAVIQNKSDVLQEAIEEDFFNNLVKINFKYIDKYYLQTQIQADKSFSITLFAASVGFLVMIVGIILMYFGKAEAGYVSTGAGVISQFIASVFFYLYNKTIVAMSGYHRKLVLTQNIGLALRITEDLPVAEKTAARVQLVERLSININELLATQHQGD